MKKIVLSEDAEFTLRTLDPEGVRRIKSWFTYLERWDTDEAVRRNSIPLEKMPGVYVLLTTTDLRFFFRIDGDTVTVLDIAKLKAILATQGISGKS